MVMEHVSLPLRALLHLADLNLTIGLELVPRAPQNLALDSILSDLVILVSIFFAILVVIILLIFLIIPIKTIDARLRNCPGV